jgi:hypothetical protein
MGIFQLFTHILSFKEQVDSVGALESFRVAEQFDQRCASPRCHHIEDFGGCVLDPDAADLYSDAGSFRSGLQEIALLASAFVQNRLKPSAIPQQDGED